MVRQRIADAGLRSVPTFAYYAVLFALSLAMLLAESFRGPAGWSLGHYADFFGATYNWSVIGRTVRLAALCTVICAVVGFPAAFALAATRGALRALPIASLLLPLSVSVIVKAFGWTVLRAATVLSTRCCRAWA